MINQLYADLAQLDDLKSSACVIWRYLRPGIKHIRPFVAPTRQGSLLTESRCGQPLTLNDSRRSERKNIFF